MGNRIMDKSTIYEKFLYIFLIILAIFIVGIQIGIAHGREIQRQEYYEYGNDDDKNGRIEVRVERI